LIVTALTGPTLAGPGQRITVSSTVKNQAGAAGAFTVGLYLLPAPVFERSQARLLGSRAVDALDANATSSASATVTIPADAVECTCFLLAVAHDGDAVRELDETNNVRVATVTIGIGRPDLVITALTGPTKVGATAQPLTLTSIVRNQGGASAAAFTVGLYLSAGGTLDRSTARLLGRRSVASLSAGAVSGEGTTVLLPRDLADGTYFLFAVADDEDTVLESDETNNVFRATA